MSSLDQPIVGEEPLEPVGPANRIASRAPRPRPTDESQELAHEAATAVPKLEIGPLATETSDLMLGSPEKTLNPMINGNRTLPDRLKYARGNPPKAGLWAGRQHAEEPIGNRVHTPEGIHARRIFVPGEQRRLVGRAKLPDGLCIDARPGTTCLLRGRCEAEVGLKKGVVGQDLFAAKPPQVVDQRNQDARKLAISRL